MNGIQHLQASFRQSKAYIAYLTAGDGGIKTTLNAALALIAGGVNLLEIGVAFSDPIADGPVIQRAATRALAAGTTLQDVLWLAENIRKRSDIPLVLFSYVNPLLAALQSTFFKQAKMAGIDGVLLVDCPIEEAADFQEQCLAQDMAPIFVIAPTTTASRIQQIAQYGQGFLYYACRKGTTGMRLNLPDDFTEKMQAIKAQVALPVVAGFGIADAVTAKQVLQHADGVVVGSLFVKAVEDNMSNEDLTRLAHSINPLRGNSP